MQPDNYHLLICGATFAGIGVALAAKAAGRHVILIERSSLLGGEFVEAFQRGQGEWLPRTQSGQWLYQEMMNRCVIGKDHRSVYLAALHPLLCLLARQQRLHVRLLTEIIDITKRDGQFQVQLHDVRGTSTIETHEVLDTSSNRLSCPGQLFVPQYKSLHAYLYHPERSEWDDGDDGDSSYAESCFSITSQQRPFQATLQMKVPVTSPWSEARQQLHHRWAQRPTAWEPWTIAAIAGRFASQVPVGPRNMMPGWKWLPSEAYSNPLEALDHGYEYGAKEWLNHAASKSR